MVSRLELRSLVDHALMGRTGINDELVQPVRVTEPGLPCSVTRPRLNNVQVDTLRLRSESHRGTSGVVHQLLVLEHVDWNPSSLVVDHMDLILHIQDQVHRRLRCIRHTQPVSCHGVFSEHLEPSTRSNPIHVLECCHDVRQVSGTELHGTLEYLVQLSALAFRPDRVVHHRWYPPGYRGVKVA